MGRDRKSTRLNSSHTVIYTLSLHDVLPIFAIKRVGDRWYLYMAHLWNRGWSIVDVTDPGKPKIAKFIPGPDNTWTIQMDLHDNLMITALQRMAPQWGEIGRAHV